jgi:hypothetical protein
MEWFISAAVCLGALAVARRAAAHSLVRSQIILLWMVWVVTTLMWVAVMRPPLTELARCARRPGESAISALCSRAQAEFGKTLGTWVTDHLTALLLVGALLLLWLTWHHLEERASEASSGQSVKHDFSDADMARHFAHHAQFSTRHPGHSWRFASITVPLSNLRCMYTDPGVSKTNPAGLMGAVGKSSTGHQGRPIADIAEEIRQSIESGTAATGNPALAKVLSFRSGGPSFILSREEPIALSQQNGDWYVREGTHRCVALALLGEPRLTAIHFESGQVI